MVECSEEGDIVSVDCGTTLDGYIGDSAFTKGVGEIGKEQARLIKVTRESLYKGIEQMRPGKHIGDVSAAIQEHVESFWLSCSAAVYRSWCWEGNA